MEKGIKNLLFDLGGVLIDLNLNRCIENFRKLGFENVSQMVNETHTTDIFAKFERGKISAGEFRDKIRQFSGNDALTDAQIDEAWLSILVGIPQEKLDLLLELRKKYRVFMLSNTNEIHFEWIRKTQFERNGRRLGDYFDQCFLSYKMGAAKPEDDAFEHVINEAQIFARETLFVDDSELNLDASRRWCFHTHCAKAGDDLSEIFTKNDD